MTTQQLLVPSNATLKRNVMDYSLIVVGSFLQALSYVLFPAPYKIVPGGVYGISIVIHYVTKDCSRSSRMVCRWVRRRFASISR